MSIHHHFLIHISSIQYPFRIFQNHHRITTPGNILIISWQKPEQWFIGHNWVRFQVLSIAYSLLILFGWICLRPLAVSGFDSGRAVHGFQILLPHSQLCLRPVAVSGSELWWILDQTVYNLCDHKNWKWIEREATVVVPCCSHVVPDIIPI